MHQARHRQQESTSTAANQPPQPSMEAMARINELRKAVAAEPRNFEYNVQLGNSYFDAGMYENAVPYYQTAIELQPKNTNVLIDLGVSYFNINQADSALIYIQTALKFDPAHRQGLYNLGIVNYNMQRFQEALDAWQKLVDLHKDTREARNAREFIKQLKVQLNQS